MINWNSLHPWIFRAPNKDLEENRHYRRRSNSTNHKHVCFGLSEQSHALHGGRWAFFTLYQNSCKEMSIISTWSHLALNVLSTLLLNASNACVQCRQDTRSPELMPKAPGLILGYPVSEICDGSTKDDGSFGLVSL